MSDSQAGKKAQGQAPRRRLGELIRETIDRQGPELLAAVLRHRAEGQPPKGRSFRETTSLARTQLKSLFRELRESGPPPRRPPLAVGSPDAGKRTVGRDLVAKLPVRWRQTLGRARASGINLPQLKDRTEQSLRLTAHSATFLSGLLLGFGLPGMNLKLFRRGKKDEGITLHQAAYFSVDVSLRWIAAVLSQTSFHPEVAAPDRERLKTMEQLLRNLLSGVQTGVSTQRPRLTRDPSSQPPAEVDVNVALDDESYRMMEIFFSSLVGK